MVVSPSTCNPSFLLLRKLLPERPPSSGLKPNKAGESYLKLSFLPPLIRSLLLNDRWAQRCLPGVLPSHSEGTKQHCAPSLPGRGEGSVGGLARSVLATACFWEMSMWGCSRLHRAVQRNSTEFLLQAQAGATKGCHLHKNLKI